MKAKIYLNLDLDPQKFKLSPELAELLDVQEETKTGVIMILWQYIKVSDTLLVIIVIFFVCV